MIKESGITWALYLEKNLKAPNKKLGDMYYDLAKKRYREREEEKVPRTLQYPERLHVSGKRQIQGGITNWLDPMAKAVYAWVRFCEGRVRNTTLH